MREITFIEATKEALDEEMARDPSIFVVGEGIGARGGNFDTTMGLYDKYGPERLRDTPISERGFTALCTGAAAAGARPVADVMFLDFALDALGDLIHQTPKMQWMSQGRLKMPLVIRGCIGILGSAGAHHSGNHYPMLMHIPGYHVVMATTAYDAKGLFKTALRSDDPVFFLEHRGVIYGRGPVPEKEYLIPFGQASVRREGTDVTVVAIAYMVNKTLEACEQLAKEGISVEVIDPRTLVPLDMDTILASVHKTGRLLIVDEDYTTCGVGAEIAAQVVARGFDDLDAPIQRLNGMAVPAPSSPPLEAAVIPNPGTIAAAIHDLLAE